MKPYTFVFHFDKYAGNFECYFIPYVFGVQNNDEYTDDDYMNPHECKYVRSFMGEYGQAHGEIVDSRHTHTFNVGPMGVDLEKVREESKKVLDRGDYRRWPELEAEAYERLNGNGYPAPTAIRVVVSHDIGEEERGRIEELAHKFCNEFVPNYWGAEYCAPLQLLEIEYRPTTLEDLY